VEEVARTRRAVYPNTFRWGGRRASSACSGSKAAGQGAAPDTLDARRKLAHDYLDVTTTPFEGTPAEEHKDDSPESIQARAREAWAAARANDLQTTGSPEDIQRLARERGQEYRQGQTSQEKPTGQSQDRTLGKDDEHTL
jgi:hypothetical protein